MHQILTLEGHQYFGNKIDLFQARHDYLTRSNVSNLFTLPLLIYSKCQRSFLYFGLREWNSIPIEIRNINKPGSFKKALKANLLG